MFSYSSCVAGKELFLKSELLTFVMKRKTMLIIARIWRVRLKLNFLSVQQKLILMIENAGNVGSFR